MALSPIAEWTGTVTATATSFSSSALVILSGTTEGGECEPLSQFIIGLVSPDSVIHGVTPIDCLVNAINNNNVAIIIITDDDDDNVLSLLAISSRLIKAQNVCKQITRRTGLLVRYQKQYQKKILLFLQESRAQ